MCRWPQPLEAQSLGDALSMARAPIRCEFQFPASSFGQDTLVSGFKVGIGFGVNEGDMEKGQEGQKGWSGWSPYSSMYGQNAELTGLVTLSDDVAPKHCSSGH